MYRERVLSLAEEISAEAQKAAPSMERVRGLSQQLCQEAEQTALSLKIIQDIASQGYPAHRTRQWLRSMEKAPNAGTLGAD